VETSQQLELVRAIGCNAAQGSLLGKPMSAAALTRRLLAERATGT
jgi:EAL domain-containing protein (putative c-di-GMP-specific phosphodiesterase class I)